MDKNGKNTLARKAEIVWDDARYHCKSLAEDLEHLAHDLIGRAEALRKCLSEAPLGLLNVEPRGFVQGAGSKIDAACAAYDARRGEAFHMRRMALEYGEAISWRDLVVIRLTPKGVSQGRESFGTLGNLYDGLPSEQPAHFDVQEWSKCHVLDGQIYGWKDFILTTPDSGGCWTMAPVDWDGFALYEWTPDLMAAMGLTPQDTARFDMFPDPRDYSYLPEMRNLLQKVAAERGVDVMAVEEEFVAGCRRVMTRDAQ